MGICSEGYLDCCSRMLAMMLKRAEMMSSRLLCPWFGEMSCSRCHRRIHQGGCRISNLRLKERARLASLGRNWNRSSEAA